MAEYYKLVCRIGTFADHPPNSERGWGADSSPTQAISENRNFVLNWAVKNDGEDWKARSPKWGPAGATIEITARRVSRRRLPGPAEMAAQAELAGLDAAL